MRYLASVHQGEVLDIKRRFRAGGVPILVLPDYSSREALRNFKMPQPPEWHRINVCLDEQFDEAKRLLADPDYVVKERVDVAKFEAEMERLGANSKVKLISMTRP